jgi:hypothetical protein
MGASMITSLLAIDRDVRFRVLRHDVGRDIGQAKRNTPQK